MTARQERLDIKPANEMYSGIVLLWWWWWGVLKINNSFCSLSIVFFFLTLQGY